MEKSTKEEFFKIYDFKTLFFTIEHLMSMRINNNKEVVSIQVDVESYISVLEKFLKTQNFYEYGFSYEINIILYMMKKQVNIWKYIGLIKIFDNTHF